MIIRNDFMNNHDGNNKPSIPGIRTPFDYVQEQSKIREAQKNQGKDKKPFASAEDLKQLEKQNTINHLHQPFGKK